MSHTALMKFSEKRKNAEKQKRQKEEGRRPPLLLLSPALPYGSGIGHRLICNGHEAMTLMPVKQLIQRIHIALIAFVSFSQRIGARKA